MTDAKPSRSLRSFRKRAAEEKAKGKVRRYLWAYPADWPEIQAHAERLTEWREAVKARDSGESS